VIHLPQDGGSERDDFGRGSRVRRGWLPAGGMRARAAFHVSSIETAGDPSNRGRDIIFAASAWQRKQFHALSDASSSGD
jgi:hypothetical protein